MGNGDSGKKESIKRRQDEKDGEWIRGEQQGRYLGDGRKRKKATNGRAREMRNERTVAREGGR